MDPNLRLALVDEVYAARSHGESWLDALRPAYEASQPETPWSVFEDLIEPMPELEAMIRALPLDPADLARIEVLVLDGDREVYTTRPSWWESGPWFAIRDLSGLLACPNLRELTLGQGLVEGCRLAPLEQLASLERLSLCTSSRYVDPEALLRFPALRRVHVANREGHPVWAPVLERLRTRGLLT